MDEELRRINREIEAHAEESAGRQLGLLEQARRDLRARIIEAQAAGLGVGVKVQMLAAIDGAVSSIQTTATSLLVADGRKAAGLGVRFADSALRKARGLVGFHLPEEFLTTVDAFFAGQVASVTTQLRQQITGRVQVAALAGTPTEELAKQIGATGIQPTGPFVTVEQRAMAIARTELNAVSNIAIEARYQNAKEVLPGLRKRWVATRDSRTRDTHRAANGQEVGIDEYFHVGGFPCRHPLDPSLPAKERVHCRCREVAIVPEDLFPDERVEVPRFQ